jgi:hypothetical protein
LVVLKRAHFSTLKNNNACIMQAFLLASPSRPLNTGRLGDAGFDCSYASKINRLA